MKIEICGCCLGDAVRADLRSVLNSLYDDRKKRRTKKGSAIFDTDAKRDIEMLDEHINALRIVLRYYGED